MEALIHIGMQKAGSTSLQAQLEGYDDGEKFYAACDGDSNLSHMAALLFGSAKIRHGFAVKLGLSAADVLRATERNRDDLHKHLRRTDRKTIILSAEGFCRLNRDAVKKFKEELEMSCDAFTIVLYLRDPIGYCRSSLQQALKAGAFPTRLPRPDYQDMLAKYFEIFGRERVHIIPFDRSKLIGGDVVSDFSQRFGLDIELSKDQNLSIHLDTQRALCALIQSGATLHGSPAHAHARASMHVLLNHILPETKEKIPSEMLRHAVVPSDIEWLYKNTGFDFRSEIPGPDTQNLAMKDFEAFMEPRPQTINDLRLFLEKHELIQDTDGSTTGMLGRLFEHLLQHHYDPMLDKFIPRSPMPSSEIVAVKQIKLAGKRITISSSKLVDMARTWLFAGAMR